MQLRCCTLLSTTRTCTQTLRSVTSAAGLPFADVVTSSVATVPFRGRSGILLVCSILQVWKLSATDLCEIARNSVLHSGFPHQVGLQLTLACLFIAQHSIYSAPAAFCLSHAPDFYSTQTVLVPMYVCQSSWMREHCDVFLTLLWQICCFAYHAAETRCSECWRQWALCPDTGEDALGEPALLAARP